MIAFIQNGGKIKDKTTSGFGKRIAAILELFRFLTCMYQHAILRQPAKFRLNQTITGGHRIRKLLPCSALVTAFD